MPRQPRVSRVWVVEQQASNGSWRKVWASICEQKAEDMRDGHEAHQRWSRRKVLPHRVVPYIREEREAKRGKR